MRKLLLPFIFVFSFASISFALTWPETVSLAEKNNNDLIGAKKQFESYEWSYKKAFSSFLPQLSASSSMRENMCTNEKTYSYGLSASYALFNGGSNIADRLRFKLE
jgi:outer membrane protein TolC